MGSFYNPVKVLINRIDEIEHVLLKLGSQVENIVLLTRGEEFLNSLSAHTIMNCFENFSVTHLQVDISNPDIEDLFHYYPQIKSADFQCIIGVGGGTILDLSKSLSALKHLEIDSTNQLRVLIEQKGYVETKTSFHGLEYRLHQEQAQK